MVTVDPGVELPEITEGQQWVVGGVVLNEQGQAFVMRRTLDRKLFPGTWDVIGGHVEAGETLIEALARETTEETGWTLRCVRRLLKTLTWKMDDGQMRHEVDFLIEVDGDLTAPKIQEREHSGYAWFDRDDLPRLLENCAPDDTFIRDVVANALTDS